MVADEAAIIATARAGIRLEEVLVQGLAFPLIKLLAVGSGQTEHFQLVKRFLDSPERYFRHCLSSPDPRSQEGSTMFRVKNGKAFQGCHLTENLVGGDEVIHETLSL